MNSGLTRAAKDSPHARGSTLTGEDEQKAATGSRGTHGDPPVANARRHGDANSPRTCGDAPFCTAGAIPWGPANPARTGINRSPSKSSRPCRGSPARTGIVRYHIERRVQLARFPRPHGDRPILRPGRPWGMSRAPPARGSSGVPHRANITDMTTPRQTGMVPRTTKTAATCRGFPRPHGDCHPEALVRLLHGEGPGTRGVQA